MGFPLTAVKWFEYDQIQGGGPAIADVRGGNGMTETAKTRGRAG